MNKPINSFVIMAAALIVSATSSVLLTRDGGATIKSSASKTEIIDALGHPVAITSSKPRIVSGYTAFTEILRELQADALIVGATNADAKELNVQSIGSHMRPDMEAILAANPEIVLLSSRRPKVVEALRQKLIGSRIQVFAAHPATVAETLQLIEALGRMTGKEAGAESIIKEAKRTLDQVKLALNKQPKVRRTVFVEIRNTPSLLSCGRDSIAADIVRRAGGDPVCKLPGSVAQFSVESLVGANPDFYLQQTGVMNKSPIPLTGHPVISRLDCIRNNQFKIVEESLLSRPGPNVAEMVAQVYEWLYAEEIH